LTDYITSTRLALIPTENNAEDQTMKLAYKVWLDNDGKAFGEGPYTLLKHVRETGSLHQAAARMGMSYRKAWLTIRASEQRLGFPLLERTVGGVSGGGSHITPAGRAFMKKYELFRKAVSRALETVYQKHFDSDAASCKDQTPQSKRK
jgi:molybdate transport system regulatory protein